MADEQVLSERTPDSDDELIQRSRNGDRSALQELFAFYIPYIRRFVAGLVSPDDVQDVAQSTSYNACREIMLGRYRACGQFKAWLFTIARNQAMDHHRKAKKHRDIDAAFAEYTPTTTSSAVENNLVMRDALKGLSAKERSVVIAKDIEKYTYPEIAKMTGDTEGALTERHHRAVKKLRSKLKS